MFTPAPGAERADVRVGDKLWYSGGEGNGPQTTILREVTAVQAGTVLYRQVDVDRAGKPGKTVRNRRQALSSLELDNPAKATGQVRYVDFPLGLGKTWSYRYQLKSKSGALSTYDIVARVEAEETVNTTRRQLQGASHPAWRAVERSRGGRLNGQGQHRQPALDPLVCPDSWELGPL